MTWPLEILISGMPLYVIKWPSPENILVTHQSSPVLPFENLNSHMLSSTQLWEVGLGGVSKPKSIYHSINSNSAFATSIVLYQAI